ncbi:MAG: ferrous iron transport protein A [Clostridiales bacterium]|nr:ferrous iron transport protein A [Clostridiales bacterium]
MKGCEGLNLSQLNAGRQGAIANIDGSCKIKRRLIELGFVNSARVSCVRKSVFGTPIIYCIMGSNIALRRSDAEKIAVINI